MLSPISSGGTTLPLLVVPTGCVRARRPAPGLSNVGTSVLRRSFGSLGLDCRRSLGSYLGRQVANVLAHLRALVLHAFGNSQVALNRALGE